jgi:hypothetical protein
MTTSKGWINTLSVLTNCTGIVPDGSQPLYPWRYAEIVPYTISIHSIPGDTLKLFLTIFSIHSIPGDK